MKVEKDDSRKKKKKKQREHAFVGTILGDNIYYTSKFFFVSK